MWIWNLEGSVLEKESLEAWTADSPSRLFHAGFSRLFVSVSQCRPSFHGFLFPFLYFAKVFVEIFSVQREILIILAKSILWKICQTFDKYFEGRAHCALCQVESYLFQRLLRKSDFNIYFEYSFQSIVQIFQIF